MTLLSWGNSGQRFFEAGTDRGVLYVAGNAGVAWNGLISVKTAPSGGSPTPFFYDGVKYANLSMAEDFGATIEAFTYPDQFAQCDGTKSLYSGLSVTQQPRSAFGLAYRTQIGNDTEGTARGYKIHLIYNALAAPSVQANTTFNSSPEAVKFSWDITTLPSYLTGSKPAAHLVIDSTKTNATTLEYLELLLYGGPDNAPRLPSMSEVAGIFAYDFGSVNLLGIASSTKTTVTNHFRDPQFKSSITTREVMTNYAKDPRFTTTVALVPKGSTPPTQGTTATTPFVGASSRRLTYTATQTNSDILETAITGAALVTVPTGYPFICTLWVRSSVNLNVNASLIGPGAVGATNVQTAMAGTSIGNWVPISISGVSVVAGAVGVKLTGSTIAGGAFIASGTTFDVGGLCVSLGGFDFAGRYFDGVANLLNDPLDATLTPQWNGTANASTSSLMGISPYDGAAIYPNLSKFHQTDNPAGSPLSARKTVRIIPVTNESFAEMFLWFDLVVGKTYRAQYTLEVPVAHPLYGTPAIASKYLAGMFDPPGNPTMEYVAGPTSGVYTVQGTFVATSSFDIRFGHGYPYGEVHISKVVIMEADETVFFFDGTTAPLVYKRQMVTPAWTDLTNPNRSTSAFQYYPALVGAAANGDAWVIDKTLWVYSTTTSTWQAAPALP